MSEREREREREKGPPTDTLSFSISASPSSYYSASISWDGIRVFLQLVTLVQSYSSSHSQGFKDEDLGNSLGSWAATVATYCPGRTLEIAQKNIMEHGEQVDE